MVERTTDQFPPRTLRRKDLALLLEVYATVAEGRTALYVSSPLTSGERAFEWHLKNGSIPSGDNAAFRDTVIEPNRREAAVYVERLRRETKRVVIDPTALADLPEWTQADYRDFWGQVIVRYASEVVFRDGWEHSSGCTYEFFVAVESGARTLRPDLTPLPLEAGVQAILAAIESNESQGRDVAFLQSVVGELRR